MFWVFGYEACRILDPSPGIKSALPTLECEVLTTGLSGKSLQRIFWMNERWKKLIYKWMDGWHRVYYRRIWMVETNSI